MKRLAGCLVVSLLASTAAWVGCRDDLGDELLPLAVGIATDDAGLGGDAYGGAAVVDAPPVPDSGSGEGGVPDAGSGVPDAPPDAGSGVPDAPPDAGSGEGGVPDAPPDAGSGEGGVPDAPSDAGDGDGGDGVADAAGRPDARRGPALDSIDRTSFYACAGGPASAGIEVGLPIALALGVAVRRRRRWQRTRPPGA